MRISVEQRTLLAFLSSSPSGRWTRATVRRALVGEPTTATERAVFSRRLHSLEQRGLIILGGGQSDRQAIVLTPRGAAIANNGGVP